MEESALKEDQLMLVTDAMGDMPHGVRRFGLYYRDTRYLSAFELRINGRSPRLLASSCRQDAVCESQLANPTIETADGAVIIARTIGIERRRFLGGALQERLTLYNYNAFPVLLDLSVTVGADFLDVYEVRGFQRARRGAIAEPTVTDSEVTFVYSGLDGVERRTIVVFETPPSSLEVEADPRVIAARTSTVLPESTDLTSSSAIHQPTATAHWILTLEPRNPVRLSFHIAAVEQGQVVDVPSYNRGLSAATKRYEDWCGECATITAHNELFSRLLERSVLDLRMLVEHTADGPVLDTGMPWFGCVYGSQAAIAAQQVLMLNPDIAVNTLRHLASHQGKGFDAERLEEPGKIVHEMRKGELARSGEIPHVAFYGGIDATPLFLILFAETLKWTDDEGFYREMLPAAKMALEWLFHYGDVDGDGYIEYGAAPADGVREYGWPDGSGVVVFSDGTTADQPLALAEVQAYAYRAMKEMSALLQRHGDTSLAEMASRRAAMLKENFNRDFWMEDERYFAQALDARKKHVPNITSAAGRCLFGDIIDEDKARYVVTRLTSPEMASGWGIRTLSNRARNYNPMSYRHGSVWPHDNSLIVAGMKRYGYHWEVEEITSQMFDASAFFPHGRLPELFAGFHRDRAAYSIPGEYPASCSPHAAAAGTSLLLFQSLLGVQADASARRLYISPRLPKWLEHASVENLRVGSKTLSLHFDRLPEEDETRFHISDNEAGVEVVIPAR